METNAQYFDCLCRTCMNKVESSSHEGTSKLQQQWLTLSDIIDECGAMRITELLSDAVPQIVVQPSDELPKKICTECLQQLLNVYWFQKMCVQSDKEMHELLSKERTALNTPMLKEEIKGETETNDPDSEPLKDLPCNSTLQNLPRPSIQEPLAEVTVQTIEQDAAQSSATDQLQDNTQLLEHCNDSQGEFEEFIKNEPIEDDEANSEYTDGDTMLSTISVTKEEVLPIEFEDQEVNGASSRHSCNKSYKRREYLTRHSNNHRKKANDNREYCFACHLCSKSFTKQHYLTRHLNQAHPKEPQLTCEFCKKSFASSYWFGRHILTHTYVSPEYGKSFTAQSSILEEHRRSHAEDKPYECPYCPLRFSSKRSASRHKLIHEGIKPYKCTICGKKFRVNSNLKRHKRVHSNEKPHKCDQCEMRFTQMEELKIHIRRHTGEKPYKCKYCERGFAASSVLRQHLRTHLGKNIHRCKFCPLAFPSSAEMRLHLISHKNEDPEVRKRNLKALQEEEAKLELKFGKDNIQRQSKKEQQQQKLSNKEIEQSSTDIISEQRTTHSEDKPYECPYCPLRFGSRSNLWKHKTIHEEIKRHECDICGRKFRIKSELTSHKRIHSNGKPHKCDQCEKRFTQMEEFKIHIRRHTGEKPYKCKYCERGFAGSSVLRQHLRSHLGKNIHRCKFCPLAFPSSAEMRLHLISHKNEDPEVRKRNLKALQEEEAKLELKFWKEKSKGQSTEKQQEQKLLNKEIEQQLTE